MLNSNAQKKMKNAFELSADEKVLDRNVKIYFWGKKYVSLTQKIDSLIYNDYSYYMRY